ncbi:hypothetical protein ACJX0J_040397, partial [Zea mays]
MNRLFLTIMNLCLIGHYSSLNWKEVGGWNTHRPNLVILEGFFFYILKISFLHQRFSISLMQIEMQENSIMKLEADLFGIIATHLTIEDTIQLWHEGVELYYLLSKCTLEIGPFFMHHLWVIGISYFGISQVLQIYVYGIMF